MTGILAMAMPKELVKRSAIDAGLTACAAFVRAEQELALPRPLRRSAAEIHREAYEAQTLASSLAAVLNGGRHASLAR